MSRILKYYDKDIFTISDHFIKVVFSFPDKNTIDGMEKDTNRVESGVINEDGTINGTINGIINHMDKEKKIIVAKMVENPRVTIKAMSDYTGYSVRKVNRIIKELKEMGIVEREGQIKRDTRGRKGDEFYAIYPVGYTLCCTISESDE